MTDRPLRILQLSPTDRMGGAEKIAHALVTGLRRRGHTATLAVGEQNGDAASFLPTQKGQKGDASLFSAPSPHTIFLDNDRARSPWSRLLHSLANTLNPTARLPGIKRLQLLLRTSLAQPARTRAKNRGEEDFDFPATQNLLPLLRHYDIFHAHNLHSPKGYFDLRLLPQISSRIPTVLTLHDAWLLSGHCAHSFDCDRWLTSCGQCPDLTIYPPIPKDATAFNWQRKRDIFSRCRLYITAPSQWLLDKAHRSILAPAIVESRLIPNGVDLTIFKPADPSAARQQLNLPLDKKTLLFAANGIRNNCFKDFATMRAALEIVSQKIPNLLLIALGESAPSESINGSELRFIPFQPDEHAVARHYQAADLYIHPARADTFPTTVLEALACAKPVVATNVGGIPEQISEGETGHLVPQGDPRSLANAIISLLTNPERARAMRDRAAQLAVQRFNVDTQITAQIAWYHQILAARQAAAS